MIDPARARRDFAGLPTVHVATVGPDGSPHVVPLWFVWRDDAVYVSSRLPSRTWSNAELEPRVCLAFDVGRAWSELSGVVLDGTAELLVADHPSLRPVMSAWHEKYRSWLPGDGFQRFTEQIEELGFLRVTPVRIASWNHATVE